MNAPSTRRDIAHALVAALQQAGTTHVFGVPGGGSNLDVVGAAVERGMQFVLTHTETAAAVMAAVAGQLNGAPGACVATRGPGAASAVNGAAQALLDRQPVVLITDCVAETDFARVSHQRLHQQHLMQPVTKWTTRLSDAAEAAAVVALATTGRPGPVHVDVDPTYSGSGLPAPAATITTAATSSWHELVRSAQRPVVVVGVGAVMTSPSRRSNVVDRLADLGTHTGTPMLCTYAARGMVADSAPWCAGVATGATIESPLLHDADLVIGVGLDPVELIPAPWPYTAPVLLLSPWHIDDSDWFSTSRTTEVVDDLAVSLQTVAGLLHSEWPPETGRRHRERAEAEVWAAVPDAPTAIIPQQIVSIARDVAPAGTIATVDAGAHMLVAVPLWHVDAPCQLLISSGLATMGYSLPAAIAAAESRPDSRVVCFTGDGGLSMALAELETLARRNLDVTVVVFNDSSLSLIAAKQAPTGNGGEAAVRYQGVDFGAVAEGLGLPAVRVDNADEYRTALTAALNRPGPGLIDALVDPSAYSAVLDAVRGARTSS